MHTSYFSKVVNVGMSSFKIPSAFFFIYLEPGYQRPHRIQIHKSDLTELRLKLFYVFK